MYRLMAMMKNGSTIVVSESPLLADINECSDDLEMMMMDPTSSRLVYRCGCRTVMAKEVVATWVEECAELK